MRSAMDLSAFDMATAFGSLCSRPVEPMEEIIQALSKAVRLLIVQCDGYLNEPGGKLRQRGTLSFVQDLLAQNRYPDQQVVTFRYCHRPLVIAKCSRATA